MELVGTAWNAATCLFRCCKAECAYVCELDENLDSLKAKWEDLQNLNRDVLRRIHEAERTREKQRTDQVQGWLQKVLNLQEELDNVLKGGYQETHNKCLGGDCPKNCLSCYKIGKKIVRMLNAVDELLSLGKPFTDPNTTIAYNLSPYSIDPIPLDEHVGLDLLFNKVWSSIEDEKVSTIGLHGMGGVGKTTLFKIIHNEFEKRKHDFKVVLWVVISKDLDSNKIMDDIGMKLRIKSDDWDEISPDQKAKQIYQVLRKENFVLMLDDLWENLELEKVGVPIITDIVRFGPSPHGFVFGNHSKRPLTNGGILCVYKPMSISCFHQCGTLFAPQQEVKCLLEEKAFNLFSKKVGEETLKCHGEIPKLAREIAQECGGLPLALVTVGSAMAGVESVEAWRQAKSDLRRSPWTASEVEKKVFSILKFSYDKLLDEIHQRCFLYCSIYPEDYKLNIDDLIDRWIGEGFLDKDKTRKSIYDMYLQGKSIIEKLKLSCLLEGVVKKERGNEPCLKMHDFIRDMALWLARDEDRKKDKVVVEGEALTMTSEMSFERLNDVEMISTIIYADERWQVPLCPNLITLCAQHKCINDYSNLQYMTKLKGLVLSDSGIANIPPEFGKLINLEFLDLSLTKIENMLPIELKNLKKLKILLMQVVRFNLQLIPLEVIESFEQLKVFRFTSLYSMFGFCRLTRGRKKILREVGVLTKIGGITYPIDNYDWHA